MKKYAKKEVGIKCAYSVGLHISTFLSGTAGFHHAQPNTMFLNCVLSLFVLVKYGTFLNKWVQIISSGIRMPTPKKKWPVLWPHVKLSPQEGGQTWNSRLTKWKNCARKITKASEGYWSAFQLSKIWRRFISISN